MASASDERRRAARLLIRVEEGAFAARLLDAETAPGVRARVLGVVRWQRALDQALNRHLRRPLERLDPEVRTALRLGAFEIVHLGVPRPVATDGMVRLVRRLGKSSAAGLVNAVLRRVEPLEPGSEVGPDLAWSHPGWLWRRWRDAFGAEAAEAAMASAQSPAPAWVWFAVDAARAEVEAAGAVLEPHPWCPGAWRAAEGQAVVMAAVAEGRAVVQDPSSQLVPRLAAALAGGGRAVDLCAAPGGKTALLERLGSWSLLVAADLGLARAARLQRRLAAHGSVPVVAGDAGRPPFRPAGWDLVLLDAPCSGTGTFRRHPELKWRLTPEAIAGSASAQASMIGPALGLLAPGGVLVYATCSVEPEENEAHFEGLPGGFDRVLPAELMPAGVPWIDTAAGGVRILPHEHGDGFTIHAVRRSRPS